MDAIELYLCQVAPPPYPNDATKALLGNRTWGSLGMTRLWDSVVAGVSLPTSSMTTPSLGSGFSNLLIVGSLLTSDSGALGLRINGDSTANYDYQQVTSSSTTVSSASTYGATNIMVGTPQSTFPGAFECVIPDALNAAVSKALVAHASYKQAASGTGVHSMSTFGNWRTSAAISTLTFFDISGGNITAGRTTVYGLN